MPHSELPFLRRIDLQRASNSQRIPYRRLPLEAHSQPGIAQRCGLSRARLSADNATNTKSGGWPPPLLYCPMGNFPGEIGDDGGMFPGPWGEPPSFACRFSCRHRRSFAIATKTYPFGELAYLRKKRTWLRLAVVTYAPFLVRKPPEERLNSNLLELIGPSHD
jgi:hypothetical protein